MITVKNKIKKAMSFIIAIFIFFPSVGWTVDDPLKGLHNMVPHDDLLLNSSYFDKTGKFVSREKAYLMDDTNLAQYKPDEKSYPQLTTTVASNSETGGVSIPARLFLSPKDSTLVLTPNNDNLTFSASLYHDDEYITSEVLPSFNASSVNTVNYNLVKADFTGSGTEEVIAIGDVVRFYFQLSNISNGLYFALIQAKDVSDPSQGFDVAKIYTPSVASSDTALQYGRAEVADLTGDGNKEIVFMSLKQIKIFTVCSGQDAPPGSVCDNQPAFTVIERPSIDLPLDSQNTQATIYKKSSSFSLTLGDFHGTGSEIAIVNNIHSSRDNNWSSGIYTFKLNSDAEVTLTGNKEIASEQLAGASILPGGYYLRGGYCFSVAGKQKLQDLTDQLWIVCQNYLIDGDKSDVGPMIGLFQATFNPNSTAIKIEDKRYTWNTGYWRIRGLAKIYSRGFPEHPEGSDFNYSLAMVMADAGNNQSVGLKLKTYQLSESSDGLIFPYTGDWESAFNYEPNITKTLVFRPYMLTNERSQGMDIRRAKNLLYTADFKGESVTLGEPLYYRAGGKEQPFFILGAPPSHIDYLKLENGEPASLVNLSLGGDKYTASFSQSSSQTEGYTSQDISKLSNTVAIQVTSEGSQGDGDAFPSPVEVSYKATAGVGYTNEQTSDTINTDTQSMSKDITEVAGVQDKVAVRKQSVTHYLYPVIGSLMCPDSDTCAEEDKVQQYITLTVPETEDLYYADGSQLPWFQPVYETNNILSYPHSLAQLEANYGSPIKILTDIASFTTSSGKGKSSLNWRSGGSSSSKTTTLNKGTWNTGFTSSFGSSKSFTKLLGSSYKLTYDFKYDGSYTDTGIVTSMSQFDAGMTIEFNRPSTFRSPSLYGYKVTPMIFGDALSSNDSNVDEFTPQAIKDALSRALLPKSKEPFGYSVI